MEDFWSYRNMVVEGSRASRFYRRGEKEVDGLIAYHR